LFNAIHGFLILERTNMFDMPIDLDTSFHWLAQNDSVALQSEPSLSSTDPIKHGAREAVAGLERTQQMAHDRWLTRSVPTVAWVVLCAAQSAKPVMPGCVAPIPHLRAACGA
jgi:hypothetical protein